MVKTLKIALFDVRHATRGLHAYQMPLSIGLLATYARQQVENAELDIRIYISADKFLEEFREWRPDIVGGSFYNWNRNLNLLCMRKAKEELPECLTLLGGPEVEKEHDKIEEFLRKYSYVDALVLGEGEKPFSEIVQYAVDDMDFRAAEILKGAFYLTPDRGSLVASPPAEKFDSLDEIPSPYTAGLFDQFFDMNLHPMILTSRGCPFGCTFCVMALKMHNKVRFQSLERIQADMAYIVDRVRGRQDIQLTICDSNFGMFKQTLPIVEVIRKHQEEDGWPRYLCLSLGKNQKERIVEASKVLKWGLPGTMSAQSLDDKVLGEIKRKNIRLDVMKNMINEMNTGSYEDTYSELIANLPHETLDGFMDGVRQMIDTGVNRIIIMTLSLLRGTPLADDESIKKHGFIVKKRIIPRAFGTYEGERIYEAEDAVAGTNTMSVEDYLHIRDFQFVINNVYNADLFNPTRRFLSEQGIDIFAWLEGVHKHVMTGSGKVRAHIDQFHQEARDEMFDTTDELDEFIKEDENYDKLLSGARGDNLMNKYLLMSLSEGFVEWTDAATAAGRQIAQGLETGSEFLESALDNIQRYQKMMYDFAPYFDTPPEADVKKRVTFDFDVHRWAMDPSVSMNDCAQKTEYEIWFTPENVQLMKNMMNSGHDLSQTKQFIYRDLKYHVFVPNVEKVEMNEENLIIAANKGASPEHLGTEHRLFR